MKILKEILKLSWVNDFNLFTIGFTSAAILNALLRKQIISLCILIPMLLLTIHSRKWVKGGYEK